MNEKKLKAMMALSGITVSELAHECGISAVSFYRKSKGITEFTQKEICIIKRVMKLSNEQLCEIFFASDVS